MNNKIINSLMEPGLVYQTRDIVSLHVLSTMMLDLPWRKGEFLGVWLTAVLSKRTSFYAVRYKLHTLCNDTFHCCLLTYLLTYLLTPWSRVLLEKLTGFAASQVIPRILWNPKVPLLIQYIRSYPPYGGRSSIWRPFLHQQPEDASCRGDRAPLITESSALLPIQYSLNIFNVLGFVHLKYRVIHKSLRDFRTRLRNNQDRHGRREYINR